MSISKNGEPDEFWGETVLAVVASIDGFVPDELKQLTGHNNQQPTTIAPATKYRDS